MAESLDFVFPTPLLQEHLLSVSYQVTRSLSEEEGKYFLTALVCLLRFSMDKLDDGQNVTLAVARKAEESDSDEQWRKQKVWVKVKTNGGSAPRVNYMATAIGIAQVDWKNNTRTFLGTVPAAIVMKVLEKHASGTLFSDFAGRKRLFQRSMSLQIDTRASTAFGDVLTMHPAKVAEILDSPVKLQQVAAELFQIFDEDSSGGIDYKEFLKFSSHFLHQPLSVSTEIFQKFKRSNETIGLKEFESIFQQFLQTWLSQESEKKQLFFWNYLTNLMANLPTIEARISFAEDERVLTELIESILQKYGMGNAVSWDLYLRLSIGLDKALYRPATATETLRRRFHEIAENELIPVERYLMEMKKAMMEIVEFLRDWDEVNRYSNLTHFSTREEALETISNIEKIREIYRRIFQYFGATESINSEQFFRFTRCQAIPSAFVITEELKSEVTHTLDEICQLFQLQRKKVVEEIDHPGRNAFTAIAQKNPEELMALAIEEYRLKAIAHDIFTEVYPVRDTHDFDTFKAYANDMCEVFKVENAEEIVHSLYDHYSTSGVITQSDLVLVLKQMIGYQLKWAKVVEINSQKLLRDPESLRSLAQKLFDQFDINHDGWIDRRELKQTILAFAGTENDSFDKIDEGVNALFDMLDTNKDGKLSLDECQEFLLKILEARVSS